MPFKDKEKRRQYMKEYMKTYMPKYRDDQKAKLEKAKRELAKPKPHIPTLRELLGVEVRSVDLIGKKPKKRKGKK